MKIGIAEKSALHMLVGGLFILLLLWISTGCGTTGAGRKVAIFATASGARMLEAHRDAEAFEKPVEARSTEWHAEKLAQYGLIATYGYLVLSDKDMSTVEKIAITGASLGVAWIVFEGSLYTFRRMHR